MDSLKFFLLVFWALAALCIAELASVALTMSDTFYNVVGILLIACFGWFSYITRCFTKIKIKK